MAVYTVYLKRKKLFGGRISVEIEADEARVDICNSGGLEFQNEHETDPGIKGSGIYYEQVALFSRGEWMYYTKKP